MITPPALCRPLAALAGLLCLLIPAIAPAMDIITATPSPGDWQARYQAFGRVSAVADSRIRLPFPVRITDSAIAPGQTVTKGAVMLRFDAPHLRQVLAAYRDARNEQTLSRQRLAVLRSNREAHTLTRKELLAGEQALAKAQAAATAAWNALQTGLAVLDTGLGRDAVNQLLDHDQVDELLRRIGALYAPFDAVVATRPPAVGAWVGKGDRLVELEDLRRVYLQVGVAPARLADWRDGATVVIKDDQRLQLTRLPGAPGIDAATGLRLLRYVADNPGGRLRDGEWVRVLHHGAPRPVLWLPTAAVVSRNGRAWCLLADTDTDSGTGTGKDGGAGPTPVEVTVGPADQGRVPVLSGLSPGQSVVVEGAYEWLYRDLKDLIRFVD